MPHNDGTLIGSEYIGVIVQVVLAHHIEFNALLLGSTDEVSLVSCPSRSGVILCKTL